MSAVEKTPSARIADVLREDAPVLDDLHRARLERRFVEAAAARTSANDAPKSMRAPRRTRVVAGAAAVAFAAAAAVYLVAFREEGPHYTIEHATGESIAAGTHLELGPADVAHAEVHHLSLTASASASIHFTTVEEADIRLSLERGTASFAFHPEERGAERVTIETPSARVEIVGTELSVHVDPSGTIVTVSEGRVRVVPVDGTEPSFVSTGEAVHVPAPPEPTTAATDEVLEGAALPTGSGGPTDAEAVEAVATLEEAPTEPIPEVDVATEVEATEVTTGVMEPELSLEDRLERAEERLGTDRAGARRELRELAGVAQPRAIRVEALLQLGDSYREANEHELALEAFANAARIGRGTESGALAIYDRARLLERMGRTDDARAGFESYLATYPDGANAAQARARLADLSVAH